MMSKNINDILNEQYRLTLSRLNGQNPSLMNSMRSEAMMKFNTWLLPTKKDEQYKYSDVSLWLCEKIKADSTLSNTDYSTLPIEQNRAGIVVCDMKTFAEEYKDIFEKYYAKSVEEDSLMMLSRAFASAGRVIYVPRKSVINGVITISDDSTEAEISLGRRDLYIFENESLAKIHIQHNHKGTINRVCEIFIEQGANVEISEEYYGSKESVFINTLYAHVMRDTFYRHISFNMSEGKCRINEYVSLADKGADATILGAVMSRNNAHIDNTTLIRHEVENCKSYENFKYVTGETATSVFSGTVYVAAGADGTQAYQQNNNILLGDNATIHSKPNLEIYADDVKCSHGATVGQLDETALFYMRQRGISIDEAKRLMLKGFLKDIVEKISSPEVVEKISERLENV